MVLGGRNDRRRGAGANRANYERHADEYRKARVRKYRAAKTAAAKK